MPSIELLKTVVREVVTSERSPRVPEPDLVMDDPDKVAAYTRAGRVDGVMAPVYVYHGAHICEVVRPGDTVIDLGCGPATQLAMVARLCPDTKFIGIDLSAEMLEKAEAHLSDLGLKNVRLEECDISDLEFLKDKSVNVAFSTMALHHLPSVEHLDDTFREINRVLTDEAGLYLADFVHLKSEKSIDYFAYQHKDRQPELFTMDYLYSLRAAFFVSDFRDAVARHLNSRGQMHVTAPICFMTAIKSRVRNRDAAVQRRALLDIGRNLPAIQKRDLKDLTMLFRLGGLPLTLLQ